MSEDWRQVLAQGINTLDLVLPESSWQQLVDYLVLLQKWNKAFNLVAPASTVQWVINHLLDSLVILPHLPLGHYLDTGCGAGLPSLPLAIVQPELRCTLLDSNGKKTRFVHEAIHRLGLQNRCSVVESRVESYQPASIYQGLVARALTSLLQWVTLTRHLMAPETRWFALKGQYPKSELNELPEHVIIENVVPLQVPGQPAARHLVILSQRCPQ